MVTFAIAEIEDGFTIVELRPGEDPQLAAARSGGVLADPRTFTTYEEATEALTEFEEEDESV